MTKKLIFLTGITLLFSSCEKLMVGEIRDNTMKDNFQLMWDKFDSHYGLFIVKGIDWDSVYTACLPQANVAQTDEELYKVLTGMLRILNDQHVTIYTTDPSIPDFNSGYNGPLPAQEDFYFKVVRDHYLTNYTELTDAFGYGMLQGNIGYIHISSFKDALKEYKTYMDKALNSLVGTKGIVFDIRDHSGGSDHVSKYIAGRFCSNKKLFMTSKKRNGPNHNDFEQTYQWYVEPEDGTKYTNPVILLTTSRTISAGETFTLAMKENTNVIQLGDTTAGAFSDEIFFELMNGWIYSISVGDYRSSDGKSYEGKGIGPDILSVNNKSDLLQNTDKTLELAIDQIK